MIMFSYYSDKHDVYTTRETIYIIKYMAVYILRVLYSRVYETEELFIIIIFFAFICNSHREFKEA